MEPCVSCIYLLYGICVKIFITSKNTIDRQYKEFIRNYTMKVELSNFQHPLPWEVIYGCVH